MKLLLAEDEPRNRDMLARRLRRCGHEVIEVVNGREAVEGVVNEAPDIILMDLAMPVMNGWEAIEIIRATNAHTPIVVLTASSLSGEQMRAFRMGAQAFLSKPIDFSQLLRAIERLSQKRDGA